MALRPMPDLLSDRLVKIGVCQDDRCKPQRNFLWHYDLCQIYYLIAWSRLAYAKTIDVSLNEISRLVHEGCTARQNLPNNWLSQSQLTLGGIRIEPQV
ncbi:hypothetical protein QE152_g3759 [Popillia japonica]|uniref:Uncharacterized protein n=1 Tax=Popillia japonica TaxID=7064 RepID=A0AAW1N2Z6_POPJA